MQLRYDCFIVLSVYTRKSGTRALQSEAVRCLFCRNSSHVHNIRFLLVFSCSEPFQAALFVPPHCLCESALGQAAFTTRAGETITHLRIADCNRQPDAHIDLFSPAHTSGLVTSLQRSNPAPRRAHGSRTHALPSRSESIQHFHGLNVRIRA